MFNVFSLTEAVNNAANGNISDITPHAYIGTMEEACEEFRYMLMAEAAEQADFYARSEEIITEAAFFSNPDTIGVLVENVFSNMGTRIKEFFAKLKKWILGLIDTMKATFFQFTKKTSEWLRIMGPRIDAARGRTGHSDFTYEMHEWKTDYVINGMSKAFDQLLKSWPTQSEVGKMFVHGSDTLVSTITSMKKFTDSYDNADADSDRAKGFIRHLSDETEKHKKAVEDDAVNFPKAVASALGGSLSTATLDDLWRSLDAEVRGGEKKIAIKIDGKVDEMRKAIEGYKNSFNAIEKAYKEYLRVINQDEKKLTDDYNQVKKYDTGDKKIPTSVITALKQNWEAKYNAISSMYNRLSGTASKMQSLNINYIKAMVGEYMSALTAYSRLKEVKEK